MNTYKQHLDIANERFQVAEQQFDEEKYHTSAHLFINSVINYHNALCQKFLNKIPRNKPHQDTTYFRELEKFLGKEFKKYQNNYEFLISHKNQTDYGIELSINMAKQIQRRAKIIKEIIEYKL